MIVKLILNLKLFIEPLKFIKPFSRFKLFANAFEPNEQLWLKNQCKSREKGMELVSKEKVMVLGN